ncbi:hypothetical protein GZL_05682 [Streptomyces sp. 769]|nr:hypothetical protein GZL_05682 [Streptomyces sp. 769]
MAGGAGGAAAERCGGRAGWCGVVRGRGVRRGPVDGERFLREGTLACVTGRQQGCRSALVEAFGRV